MRAVEPKQENRILRRFTRTSQHAARQHRENVGQLVVPGRFFALTTDLEMEHVKGTVIGVGDGAPIMAKDYPALQELSKTCAGELQSPLLCLLLINGPDEVLDVPDGVLFSVQDVLLSG